MAAKAYFSVYTLGEKVWVYADVVKVESGCLSFYDLDSNGTEVLTTSFAKGYWQYMYEADTKTGESIPEIIPYWKRHKVTQ